MLFMVLGLFFKPFERKQVFDHFCLVGSRFSRPVGSIPAASPSNQADKVYEEF
jgi:hypothetical protein